MTFPPPRPTLARPPAALLGPGRSCSATERHSAAFLKQTFPQLRAWDDLTLVRAWQSYLRAWRRPTETVPDEEFILHLNVLALAPELSNVRFDDEPYSETLDLLRSLK